MRSIKIIALIICGILFIQGCQGRTTSLSTESSGVPLKDICAHYNVQWQWDGVTQVVLLEYKGNKAKGLVGSNVILLGNNKIFLSGPVMRSNNTIYVPEDFELKVLGSVGVAIGQMAKPDLSMSRIHTIVLDAGHGGKDPGAKGVTGVLEKDVVLDIVKRLKNILEEAGMKVILTRSTDDFISLPRRTEITSKSDADIFVSIHANSNPNHKTQGIEVYYVKTQIKRDLDEDQREKNEKDFLNHMQARNTGTLNSIVGDMMYSLKVSESSRLAHVVADHTTGIVQTPNRGPHPCRFFVVRNTLIPAILVEVGFLTNRQEERKLNTSLYRQKLAEGIASSILDYATE